jgi:hypothetical protein
MSGSRRAHVRYDLSLSHTLRVECVGYAQNLKLVTIGEGGCSFRSPSLLNDVFPPLGLNLIFEMQTESGQSTFEVSATVIYVSPFNRTQEFLYGLKFDSIQASTFEPIETELKALVEKGIVLKQMPEASPSRAG